MIRNHNEKEYLRAIVRIQKLLLKNHENEKLWNNILDILGHTTKLSRIYIFRNYTDESGEMYMSQKFEWCNKGVQSFLDDPGLKKLYYYEYSYRFTEAIQKKKPYQAIESDFDEFEKNILTPQNIKSVLALPIFVGREFYGFIGFDDCEIESYWDGKIIDLLQSVINSIVIYLKNKKSQHKLENALSNIKLSVREMHHRIKNNLNIIQSLLDLQLHSELKKFKEDGNVDGFEEKCFNKLYGIIDDVKSRIIAISLIHSMVHDIDDTQSVDFPLFIKSLLQYINDLFYAKEKKIQLEYEFDNLQIDIDKSVPCGLIVNELISNAFKYAFPKVNEGFIKISLKKNNDKIILKVADNGVGLPDKYRDLSDVNSIGNGSIGLSLIRGLTYQIGGTFSFETSDEGTEFTIIF